MENTEIRRVQSIFGDRSFSIVLPKSLAENIGIEKGDYCRVSQDGKRLIIERVEEKT